MELNNLPFLKYIGAKNVPVILSTGMGNMEEIARAVNAIKQSGNAQIVIFHCISIYPAASEITNLRNIITLKERFPNCVIGFSDHSIGPELAPTSLALGARVIEKHFTLDQSKIGMDNQMAIECDEFKNKITGIYDQASQDECKNYFYYLRNLVINLDNGNQIFIGVATDYAEEYPDAPYYWVLERNNIIDKNGSTNIDKYSLYFELSK